MMMKFPAHRFRIALKAASWHLLISAVVVLIAAVLVFGIWYPFPYSELVGGRNIFFLIAMVDVACGPTLTLILFSPSKARKELFLDLGLVALIQLGALGYGLYSVALARPVYLVFQVNDFRAVIAADVNPDELESAPMAWRRLPWFGPEIIGTRAPHNAEDRMNATAMAFQGYEISVRPTWWQNYDLNRTSVLGASKSIPELIDRQPSKRALIDASVKKIGFPASNLLWIPLVTRRTTDWVVFVDRTTADVLGFAHVDGYEIEPSGHK